MSCCTEIVFVAKTKNKLNIQSDLNYGYIHNFYHYKNEIIDELFYHYHLPSLKDIYHPALIQERKQTIDAASYEKYIHKEINLTSKKK